MEMERRWIYKEMAPFAGMIAAECANVGSNTVFKAATAGGALSFYVFNAYASIVAAFVSLPFALIFRRSAELPADKVSFLLKVACLSATGMSCMLLGYKGIEYSSPTLSSAISNLIPAFTFVLAVFFRMEKIGWKSRSSIVKMMGCAVSISGALIVVLYKGPILLPNPAPKFDPTPSRVGSLGSSQPNWILGGLCFFFQYFLNSVWYILQTHIIEIYGDEVVVVCVYYVIEAVLGVVVGLLVEADMSAWRLTTPLAVLAILNSGIMGQSFVTVVHTWGLYVKGPVYVSSFRPLSIAIAAAMGAIFLGDHLYLGSVIGAVIIATGFYAIMWGKAKEEESNQKSGFCCLESSSNAKAPLLQYYKVEDA